MTGQVIDMLSGVFGQCFVWFQSLVDSVDGKYYIVSAFVMAAVAALIVYPIRGSGFGATSFSGFTRSVVNSRRRSEYKERRNK